MPKVSIVLPNFNHAKYLRERLDSIFNQTYQDFEVILLDDNSTDGSLDILSEYISHEKVSHFVINSENSGSPFKQWQKGIALAKGEFIWIAESDDWAEITFLERTLVLLENNLDAGLVYVNSNMVTSDGNLMGLYDYKKIGFQNTEKWESDYIQGGREEISKYLIKRNIIPNASGVLIRSAKIPESIRFFNEFRLLGDWMLWIKILEKSDIIFLYENLNFFRSSENNTRLHNTNTKKVARIFEGLILDKYLLKKHLITNHDYEIRFRKNVKHILKLKGTLNFLLFCLSKWRTFNLRDAKSISYLLGKTFIKLRFL